MFRKCLSGGRMANRAGRTELDIANSDIKGQKRGRKRANRGLTTSEELASPDPSTQETRAQREQEGGVPTSHTDDPL